MYNNYKLHHFPNHIVLKYALSCFKAVGLGARFIKLGGLSRGERVTKYNRLLAIEEELAKNRTLRMSFFLTLFSACNEYENKDWREND